METTFEQAVEVVRGLSADDLERLEEWIERKKAGESEEENNKQDIYRRRMEWLKANREKYGGQYIVLDGDRLLGVAPSYPEGRKIAESYGVPDAFVNYLSRPDEEGFMGGW